MTGATFGSPTAYAQLNPLASLGVSGATPFATQPYAAITGQGPASWGIQSGQSGQPLQQVLHLLQIVPQQLQQLQQLQQQHIQQLQQLLQIVSQQIQQLQHQLQTQQQPFGQTIGLPGFAMSPFAGSLGWSPVQQGSQVM